MLLTLPTEVVVELLTWVDVQSLLRCRRVCSSLRDAIDNEPSLQLSVELTRSELSYTTDNGLCSDVIERLRQQRKNWHELAWTGKYEHPLTGPCNAYEMVDGLFVKTDSDGQIIILELPTTRNPSFKVLIDDHIGFQPGDFTLDATQDLIVFLKLESGMNVFDSAKRTASLRLLSISRLEDHPEATKCIFYFTVTADAVWGNSIHRAVTQIAGDALAIFVCSGTTVRLLVWNWRSGKPIGDSDSNGSSLPAGTHSFTFVSPSLFYVTTTADGAGEIVLFSIDTSGSRPGFTHVASLNLPNLQENIVLHSFGCHTEQYRAKRSTRTAPTLLRKQLHSFTLTYLDATNFTHYDFRMLAPASLFLDYHELYLKRGAESPVIAAWDDWGPFHTRFQGADTVYHWLRYIHGQRLVMPLEGRDVEIQDFNVMAHSESVPPTILPRESVFEDMVVSRLPYNESKKTLEEDYHGLMIDNDRIVALSRFYMSADAHESSKTEEDGMSRVDLTKLEGDEAELARMGRLNGFGELIVDLPFSHGTQNFGVSFSIISVITGIPSLFLYGLNTGGPVVMVWGWVVISCATMLVGLAMAGGLFFLLQGKYALTYLRLPRSEESPLEKIRLGQEVRVRPWFVGGIADILLGINRPPMASLLDCLGPAMACKIIDLQSKCTVSGLVTWDPLERLARARFPLKGLLCGPCLERLVVSDVTCAKPECLKVHSVSGEQGEHSVLLDTRGYHVRACTRGASLVFYFDVKAVLCGYCAHPLFGDGRVGCGACHQSVQDVYLEYTRGYVEEVIAGLLRRN
ncbi:hypothetical protein NMY22_g8036 [Coprinellus aureogranulatus]|nr:hypothetical protein NMY22_g8036 [Coprinellus aureogranulatus]